MRVPKRIRPIRAALSGAVALSLLAGFSLAINVNDSQHFAIEAKEPAPGSAPRE